MFYFQRIDSVNVLFFFFQAEDGIRDLVRSRGLGDVYKRQSLLRGQYEDNHLAPGENGSEFYHCFYRTLYLLLSVSYTHLTLPTSDLV